MALPAITFTPELPTNALRLRNTTTQLVAGSTTVTQPLILHEYLYGETHLDDPAVLIDGATGNVYTYLCDQIGTIYALAKQPRHHHRSLRLRRLRKTLLAQRGPRRHPVHGGRPAPAADHGSHRLAP